MDTARFYRPELDVLRFVAFSMVLVGHTMPIGAALYESWSRFPRVRFLLASLQVAGAFGVCVFFCLSAYLIATLLLRERDITGDINLKSFYIRRVLRIWPLYLAALIAGIPPSSADHVPYRTTLLFFLFFAGNWYCGIYGFPSSPIGPLWSISVEEQFYLFIPLLAKRGGRRTLAIVAAVLFALFPVALGVLVRFHAGPMAVWTNSFVQFSSFATGLALAVWLHGSPHRITSRSRQLLLGMAAGVLLVIASLLLSMDAGLGTNWPELAAGFTAVSFGSAIGIYAVIARPWNPHSILVYFGKISYGLYVFHIWAINIVKIMLSELSPSASTGSILYWSILLPISFSLTLLAASLSYRFFESPFLRLKDRFALVHSRPV